MREERHVASTSNRRRAGDRRARRRSGQQRRRTRAEIAGEARPADLRRRAARDRPRLLRGPSPGVRARRARQRRRRLLERADDLPVRLLSRHGRPADRRWTGHHRRVLRRHLQPSAAGAGNDRLHDGLVRHGGGLDRGGRPLAEPDHARRRAADPRPGTDRTPDQHPSSDPGELGRYHQGRADDDADAAIAARPRGDTRRSDLVHTAVPAQLHPGEHRLRGRPESRPPHGLVRQTPRIRDPERAVGCRRPGPVHAGDQQHRGQRR